MRTGSLFDAADLPIALRPPAFFRVLPRRLEIEFSCPRCAYGWAGNPLPTTVDAEADLSGEPAKAPT